MVMVRWKGDGGRGDQLVDHPSCMLIVEFLRSLAIDSFTSSTTKLGAVLDVMLEVAVCHLAPHHCYHYHHDFNKQRLFCTNTASVSSFICTRQRSNVLSS